MTVHGMPGDGWAEQTASWAAEPLMDELMPYVEEDGPLGAPMLRHPLIYDMFVTAMPGQANERYRQKKATAERALAAQDWSRYVWTHERPYRFAAVMTAFHAGAEGEDFWSLVGDVWVDSENVWQNFDEWVELFESAAGAEHVWMMGEDNTAAFDALPETLTVWRGAQREVNEDGLSYSLDRERAVWFAKRFERAGEEPVLIEAQVAKADVVAHFANRNESEIVALPEAVEIICYHEVEEA